MPPPRCGGGRLRLYTSAAGAEGAPAADDGRCENSALSACHAGGAAVRFTKPSVATLTLGW